MPELEDALQRGVMPRATDADGNTLLHAACARGALRAAKLVVRWAVYSTHPPDRNFLNLQSAEGFTALDLARAGGFRKMEEWLVALGALGRGGTGAGSLAYDPSGARSTGPPGGAYGGHHTAPHHNPYNPPGGWTHPGITPPPLPYGSSAGGAYPAGMGYPGHVAPTHVAGRHVSSYEPYVPSNAWGEDPGALDRSLARAAGAPEARRRRTRTSWAPWRRRWGADPTTAGWDKRARRGDGPAVVRQVAEAMEERDDALDELDETMEKMRSWKPRSGTRRPGRSARCGTPRRRWRRNARMSRRRCSRRWASRRRGRFRWRRSARRRGRNATRSRRRWTLSTTRWRT